MVFALDLVDPAQIAVLQFVPAQFGTATMQLKVPNSELVVDLHIFAQSIGLDAGVPGGKAFSNGLETTIGCQ